MSCSCAVSRMPPCGWCESSYECEICKEIKSQHEEAMFVVGEIVETIVCESCYADLSEANSVTSVGVNNCKCDMRDLMMQGCKCGGI